MKLTFPVLASPRQGGYAGFVSFSDFGGQILAFLAGI
jgi:hypothetical protein